MNRNGNGNDGIGGGDGIDGGIGIESACALDTRTYAYQLCFGEQPERALKIKQLVNINTINEKIC